jgi:Flp pilus assembly protein TadD
MRTPAIVFITVSVAALGGCASASNRDAFRNTTGTNVAQRGDRLLQLAADVEARGDTIAAIALYRQAAAVPGDALVANIRLGDAYTSIDSFKQAIAAYRAALATDPDSGVALLGLGTALIRTNNIDSGLAALSRAAPIVGTAIAYNRLGLAQTSAGRMREAIESLERAAALAPDDLDFRVNLALAAALDGRDHRAIGLAREIGRSPKAETRHRRNVIIVLGLFGRAADAHSAIVGEIPPSEVQALLARAGAIRAIKDVKARAKALGTIMG